MFTYNENRVLFVERGTLNFPNKAVIVMEFAPSPVLGDQLPGLTSSVGSSARMTWNANTGRSAAESDPPLPPAKMAVDVGGMHVRINARSLRASFQCSSRKQLIGALGALHFAAPLSLGLDFHDALTLAVTSGRVGDARFVWQVQGTSSYHEAIEGAERNSRCAKAILRLPMLCDPENRRLLAACTYYQKVSRLLLVGSGPTEFAAEAVVNLAKILEVIFPGERSRDAVRQGLTSLGYDEAFIEKIFMPSLLLRSHLDAAHVRMATLTADERRKLQIYVEKVAQEFRDMLVRIVEAVAEGRFQLATYKEERKPGDDISKMLDGLT